ncbi:MAG: DNA/RNA non-specific endonuclease [Bacillota bacterium]
MNNIMKKSILLILCLAMILSFAGCVDIEEYLPTGSDVVATASPSGSTSTDSSGDDASSFVDGTSETLSLSFGEVPSYSGEMYVDVNDNEPFFEAAMLTDVSFEYYSELDSLGRCGYTVASIGQDIMPTDERGSISSVYPTGWVQGQYDFVSGTYLYNRSHLIGWQLTGENANKLNLITGTRSANVDGMLPFENMVADYVKETGNHVLYRVTPIFEGNNLVATGILMEAKSVEDDGEGVLFNVFVYNVEPGVVIDYATGQNWADDDADAGVVAGNPSPESDEQEAEWIDEIDTNANGQVTIAEAEAAGYSMPITSDFWLYKYMSDADGDGKVGSIK